MQPWLVLSCVTITSQQKPDMVSYRYTKSVHPSFLHPARLSSDVECLVLYWGPNHTTARWEKRYNQQVSATEKALLEKRNTRISLREIERVLEEERADAARAAHEASVAAAEAAETLRDIADVQDEREGGLKVAFR